ncbi:MAG TPA: sugar transferase [Candidatus Kapabacteria bacterium]|nr:sugar transferase [Candidatus Kapabacteria bacterium]
MKRTELLLMVLQVPMDFFMLFLAGLLAYSFRFTAWAVHLKPVQFNLPLGEYVNVLGTVAIGWLIIFALLGLYSTDSNRKITQELSRIFFACLIGLGAIAVYLLFSTERFDSRFLVGVGTMLAIVFVVFGRLVVRGLKAILYRLHIGLRRIVVIGSGHVTEAIVAMLGNRRELGYEVVGTYPQFTAATVSALNTLQPDEVLFTNPRANEEETLQAIDYCLEHHLTFKYSADLFATYATNMAVHPLAGVPIVELRRTRLEGWGRVVKWIADSVGSVIMIILTSPIMLVTAIVILIESGRPVLYKNERVGKFGKRFFTYKFRSMYQKYCTGPQFKNTTAEVFEQELIQTQNTKAGPVYKIGNDPRVTPFGRFIRRWSIDELPQFFNVLRGEMSIVGPRPHQPKEVAQYEKHHKHVLHIKPGVTGLAQISGRSDLTFEEEVRLDVLYMEKWSLILDLIIFLKTPFILCKKRKAL